jgi:hypothetical protein
VLTALGDAMPVFSQAMVFGAVLPAGANEALEMLLLT